ncbi:MAG: response regulator transcription factor [Deltaproteobacteria bacterium]|nr:response regulator transcription factor [Deltaproteobacteria bacterium]MBM4286115.1 response regulator transcription factor [Deltaproteobacteria bacterium]
MSIKIIIADDHQIVRQGLRTLLEKEPDLEVVAEAEDGRKTVSLVEEMHPQVVIMDVNMPELNGIEATRQILTRHPGVKVIALSMHTDRRFVLNMMRAGASGYLLKDCAFEELSQAIRLVLANKTYLSPGVAEIIIQDYVRGIPQQASSAFSVLTRREREVLQLMAEGKSTSQIAEAIHVSVKTVETHRQQIMNKLGIRSIAELTKYAIREGLTSLEI